MRGDPVSTKRDYNGVYLFWFVSLFSRAKFDFYPWRICFWGNERVEDRHKTYEAADPVLYSANELYNVRINKQTKTQQQILQNQFYTLDT